MYIHIEQILGQILKQIYSLPKLYKDEIYSLHIEQILKQIHSLPNFIRIKYIHIEQILKQIYSPPKLQKEHKYISGYYLNAV